MPVAEAKLAFLGSYQIVEELDAVRLKAFEPRLQRFVTIRLLEAEAAGDPAARQRFVRLARAAASVDHENVVTVHAVDDSAAQPFVVTEFVAGTSLADWLATADKPELKEILRLGQQTAAGLAAIHARGLSHGNLHPSTILLEEGSGRVKLLDTGLVGLTDPQGEGKESTIQGDLVALGGVLFALCGGREVAGKADALEGVPAWLCELSNTLLARQASPSAAQTAELLRQHLAALQVRPAAPAPLAAPAKRRGLRIAGLVLLLLVLGAGGLAWSEATGQTHLLGSAGPRYSGEATLVIELQDPDARVSLAGFDADLSEPKTREMRLRPGDYLLRIERTDRPLEERVIALGWGERQIVTVPVEPPPVRSKPFVVRSRRGLSEREYATLAEAVRAARWRDTIEVHGNGPFSSPPIVVGSKPLTIRAARGYRPVVEFAGPADTKVNYLESRGPLVLEGLDLRCRGGKPPGAGSWSSIVNVQDATLHVAYCKFLMREDSGRCLGTNGSRETVVRNCLLLRNQSSWYSTIGVSRLPSRGRVAVLDSVLAGGGHAAEVSQDSPAALDASVQMRGNTLLANGTWWLGDFTGSPFIRIELRGNVFDNTNQFFFYSKTVVKGKSLVGAEVEVALTRQVRWRMHDNLLPEDVPMGKFYTSSPWAAIPGMRERTTLKDWDQLWGLRPNHSIQGRPGYEGGDLFTRLREAPAEVQAEDFKLTSDSPGWRGPGRRDLGADVNDLGPGPAYDRWRKSAGYRTWQKETGQIP
jgi:hypothetical protein